MTYATPKNLAYPLKSHPGISGPKPKPLELRSPNLPYMIRIPPSVEAAIRIYGDGSLSHGIVIMYEYCVRTNP
jgi:hypothetical protein